MTGALLQEQSGTELTSWDQELPGTKNPDVLFVSRIVERGYYSERDAAHVIKQILEAVAVMSFLQFPSVLVRSSPLIFWLWLVHVPVKQEQRSKELISTCREPEAAVL